MVAYILTIDINISTETERIAMWDLTPFIYLFIYYELCYLLIPLRLDLYKLKQMKTIFPQGEGIN